MKSIPRRSSDSFTAAHSNLICSLSHCSSRPGKGLGGFLSEAAKVRVFLSEDLNPQDPGKRTSIRPVSSVMSGQKMSNFGEKCLGPFRIPGLPEFFPARLNHDSGSTKSRARPALMTHFVTLITMSVSIVTVSFMMRKRVIVVLK